MNHFVYKQSGKALYNSLHYQNSCWLFVFWSTNCCSLTRFTLFEFFFGKSTLTGHWRMYNRKRKYCCWQCTWHSTLLKGRQTLAKASKRLLLGTKPKSSSCAVKVWHCGHLLSIKYDLISSSGHYQYCTKSWLRYFKQFSQNQPLSLLYVPFSPHVFLIFFAVSLSTIFTTLGQTSLFVCFSTDTSRSIPTTRTDKNP